METSLGFWRFIVRLYFNYILQLFCLETHFWLCKYRNNIVKNWPYIHWIVSQFITLNNPNTALLLDSNGRQDTVTCFSHDANADVHYGCSLTWHNSFYVFGGESKRQINQVIGTRLAIVGELTFDHFYGACSVMGTESVFLCFDYGDRRRCRVALDPLGLFSEVKLSTYDHWLSGNPASSCKYKFIRTLTSFRT